METNETLIENIKSTFGEHLLDDKILFSVYVQDVARVSDCTITEVLLEICETYDIEYETISNLLTDVVKGTLQREGIESGLLKKENTLEDFLEV